MYILAGLGSAFHGDGGAPDSGGALLLQEVLQAVGVEGGGGEGHRLALQPAPIDDRLHARGALLPSNNASHKRLPFEGAVSQV